MGFAYDDSGQFFHVRPAALPVNYRFTSAAYEQLNIN
jgi:hypothetical protein